MKPTLMLMVLALVLGSCGDSTGAAGGAADTDQLAAQATTSTTLASTTTTVAAGEPLEFGTVGIDGDSLPVLDDANDPAVGLIAPEVSGTDFRGNEVAIRHDGTAKAIVFLAHWCPHCQSELPEVSDLVAAGGVEGVEIIAVATGTNETRPNFPPSEWFEREGWLGGVIADDENYSVLRAYGGPAFPFWTFLTKDGEVALRIAGRVPASSLVAILEELSEQ